MAEARPALAFNQPILNLGFTSMMDGGPTDPGAYFLEYVRFIDTNLAVDQHGDAIPGAARVSGIINLHQLYYLSNWKILGGNFGANVVLPIIGVHGEGSLAGAPVTTNSNGPGDLYTGAQIQWNSHTLLGRPFAHYVEVDFGLPTGKYDPSFMVNPGDHVVTVNPYWSFTWFFREKWETSWKFNYAWHTENPRTHVRPGDASLVTYEFSREVSAKLRAGFGGYFLQQVTDDRSSGSAIDGSRERAVSIGPVAGYFGNGLVVFASYFAETCVRSRFRANSATVQLVHKFN